MGSGADEMAFVKWTILPGASSSVRWGGGAGAAVGCRRPRRHARTSVRCMDVSNSPNEGVGGGEHVNEGADETSKDASTNDNEPASPELVAKVLRSDLLEGVREKYRRMQAKLDQLVKDEQYMEAAKVRDDMKEVRAMDPLMTFEDLQAELREKVKAEKYAECVQIRNRMQELREQIPQMKLEGFWTGNQGVLYMNVEGLRIRAVKVADDKLFRRGDLIFEGDLSFNGMVPLHADKKVELILKVLPGLKPKFMYRGRGVIVHEGNRAVMDGFIVMFERNVAAFIVPSISLLMLYQRQKGNVENGAPPAPKASRLPPANVTPRKSTPPSGSTGPTGGGGSGSGPPPSNRPRGGPSGGPGRRFGTSPPPPPSSGTGPRGPTGTGRRPPNPPGPSNRPGPRNRRPPGGGPPGGSSGQR